MCVSVPHLSSQQHGVIDEKACAVCSVCQLQGVKALLHPPNVVHTYIHIYSKQSRTCMYSMGMCCAGSLHASRYTAPPELARA